MNPEERRDLAEERAERYAPRPTGGVLMAGFCGAVVALLVDVCVSRFYGWPIEDHLLVTALAMMLGFAGVALGYARRGRRHRAAARRELDSIDRKEDA